MDDDREVIFIVSGLPRSGTSMMMQMLEAGGMPVLTDGIRRADEDNPRGYYEFERVKKIKEDKSWLKEAEGKAVKMVSVLLYELPSDQHYKIIFMQRNMKEILASQRVMLERMAQSASSEVDDGVLRQRFERHLQEVEAWLAKQKCMDVLFVAYNEVVENPETQVALVVDFLERDLSTAKMAAVFDRGLYRQRGFSSRFSLAGDGSVDNQQGIV